MKNVAALTAASFLVLLVACAPDRSATQQSAEASVPPAGTAPSRSFPAHNAARDGEVRDAKEAAEDAARKILEATRSAASRIRDAGVDAVQAIQSGNGEEPVRTPHDEVADAQPAAPAGAVPARN
ncbi:MAG: hypothetical protein LPJ87_03570 [Zoogloeaceae bacterium]|mgnify:CR=1 FL=1|nr:hypothetical protein [Zoogloeaceae bacterium]